MKFKSLALAVAPALLLAWVIPASADTTQAECEFHHHGDLKKKDSGPCEFSQRQGYVTIRLTSGKEFQLKPAKHANRFHDQNGDDVKLKNATTESSTYKWDHKSIIVHWNRGGHVQGNQNNYQSNVPPSLKDMMGAPARNVDAELERRGYKYRNGWTDGDSKYSAWQEQENGTCVAVGVSNGRISAIDYVSQNECRQ